MPTSRRDRLARHWRTVRRAVLSRRRPLAALLAAGAVLAGFHEVARTRRADESVLTAARDLPAGTTAGARDLRPVAFAAGTAPAAWQTRGRAGAGGAAAGRRAGHRRPPGRGGPAGGVPRPVAVPVRLPDAGMAGLLRVGDRIDLVAADPQGGTAHLVAADLPVLALPATDDDVVGRAPGRLVVLAAPETVRTALAQAAVSRFLTYRLRALACCAARSPWPALGRGR